MAKGKWVKLSSDVVSALEGAANEMADLAEEMRAWADNMSNANMDHMDKFTVVEQAADTLESAELNEIAQRLADKLNECIEGEEGHAACPKHAWGVPCANCRWDGNATELVVLAPDERRPAWVSQDPIAHDRPMRLTVANICKRSASGRKVWRMINASWADGPLVPGNELIAAYARMREVQAREEKRLRNGAPPAGQRFVATVQPVEQLAGLLTENITWTEFRAYGKKSLSRADRFGNALSAAQAARDALTEKLEALTFEDKEGLEAEQVDELKEIVQELDQAIGELEGSVEFPGMYG